MGASIALALCDGSRKAIMYGTGSSSPTRPPQLPPATGHVPSACPKRIALGRLRRYGANDSRILPTALAQPRQRVAATEGLAGNPTGLEEGPELDLPPPAGAEGPSGPERPSRHRRRHALPQIPRIWCRHIVPQRHV